jgi:hypothetical protein
MFEKKYLNDLISRSAESASDRARFRKTASAAGLGLVGAGLLRWMATPALAAQASNANAISDSTILDFALDLECLEAEFHSYAVNGEGPRESLTHGTGQRGPVAGGSRSRPDQGKGDLRHIRQRGQLRLRGRRGHRLQGSSAVRRRLRIRD